MTNNVGKALFSKAGELGVPVGFMCFKVLTVHTSFHLKSQNRINKTFESCNATLVFLSKLYGLASQDEISRDLIFILQKFWNFVQNFLQQ